jgi:hypothetical protein
MRRPRRNDSAVLLLLPKQILEQVDIAVREQGVTRLQFLRQSIERNLSTISAASAHCSPESFSRA